MRLNVRAFALTTGLVWGIGVFLLTWWIMAFEGASGEVTALGRIYHGYALTPVGSVVGLIWALVDGLLGGAVFAWLYNRFVGATARTS